MDASGFTSNPFQNPTLTIMALCVRSCDYFISELRQSAIQAREIFGTERTAALPALAAGDLLH